MKDLIYFLLSLLWIVGASEVDEAIDYGLAIDNDLEDYLEDEDRRSLRSFRYRTNVKTCPDGSKCSRDRECDWLAYCVSSV